MQTEQIVEVLCRLGFEHRRTIGSPTDRSLCVSLYIFLYIILYPLMLVQFDHGNIIEKKEDALINFSIKLRGG